MKKNITQEEKKILSSVNRGEWKSIRGLSKKRLEYSQYAKSTILKKAKSINIKISEQDLDVLKTKAQKKGVSYQVLLSTIVHNYVHNI